MQSETRVNELRWASDDGYYEVQLPATVWRQLCTWCQRVGSQETGGILIGSYQEDGLVANVTRALRAPADSQSGPTTFHRGVQGVNRALRRLWGSRRQYYLGEWHYHPCAAPVPSPTDHRQMRAIASDVAYACPEPILLIIGHQSHRNWQAQALVYPHIRSQPLTLLAHIISLKQSV